MEVARHHSAIHDYVNARDIASLWAAQEVDNGCEFARTAAAPECCLLDHSFRATVLFEFRHWGHDSGWRNGTETRTALRPLPRSILAKQSDPALCKSVREPILAPKWRDLVYLFEKSSLRGSSRMGSTGGGRRR